MEKTVRKDGPESPYNEVEADIPAWVIRASAALSDKEEKDEGVVE